MYKIYQIRVVREVLTWSTKVHKFSLMSEKFFIFLRHVIPKSIARRVRPAYHWLLAFCSAAFYRFPSRKLIVIGVTGTNGKTTVVHLTTDIFEAAGFPVASISSVRFKVKGKEWPNDLKQTMPGRFQIQKFLRRALNAGVTHVVLEVTSEGIKQFRHRFIRFQAVALTNVTPEHIESHGGFEKYKQAKAELFRRAPTHILNSADREYQFFARIPAYAKASAGKPAQKKFTYDGSGDFTQANAACALVIAKVYGIDQQLALRVAQNFKGVPGRIEFIENERGLKIVVDYAHTPDAMQKLYKKLVASRQSPVAKMFCVFGATGGGRDKWKRPEFARIAQVYCDQIFLTNEDPYDENPAAILKDIESGFSQTQNYKEVLDRKEAIRAAIESARAGDTIVITGKGCEQVMVLANDKKVPWDDRRVVREGLTEPK